jgi:hypothetical protein
LEDFGLDGRDRDRLGSSYSYSLILRDGDVDWDPLGFVVAACSLAGNRLHSIVEFSRWVEPFPC